MIKKYKTAPSVSVVLSFYNEMNILPELLGRLRKTLNSEIKQKTIKKYEIIFVNDASTDKSEDLLREEIKTSNDIVLVNMSRNFGVSECVFAGMNQAKGDIVIYMDSDLQDPPELISEMIKKWREDPEVEVVYTTRKSRPGESKLKLLYTKIGYRIVNWISDVELPVDSGDFKLLSRRAVDELLSIQETHPYLRGLISWLGFKQAQVLYDREVRFDGRENTKFPVFNKRVLYYHLDRALISFSDAPLKLTLFTGFLVSFLAIIYIGVVLFQKIMGWYEPGWPALMCAILFLGGVQLMVIGFLGLYIKNIYYQVKPRPNYIVKEVVESEKKKK